MPFFPKQRSNGLPEANNTHRWVSQAFRLFQRPNHDRSKCLRRKLLTSSRLFAIVLISMLGIAGVTSCGSADRQGSEPTAKFTPHTEFPRRDRFLESHRCKSTEILPELHAGITGIKELVHSRFLIIVSPSADLYFHREVPIGINPDLDMILQRKVRKDQNRLIARAVLYRARYRKTCDYAYMRDIDIYPFAGKGESRER